jgi:hypothetical protein
MTREKSVFGQVKMRGVSSANQESIMLIEGELTPRVGPFQDSESDAHGI